MYLVDTQAPTLVIMNVPTVVQMSSKRQKTYTTVWLQLVGSNYI